VKRRRQGEGDYSTHGRSVHPKSGTESDRSSRGRLNSGKKSAIRKKRKKVTPPGKRLLERRSKNPARSGKEREHFTFHEEKKNFIRGERIRKERRIFFFSYKQ